MTELHLVHDHISNEDINACITEFSQLKRKPTPLLKISAQQRLTDFDILLIGYFILFKREVPSLRIQLHLPNNTREDKTGVFFKLMQFGTYAHLMTGVTVFEAYFANNTDPEPLFIGKQYNRSYLVLSESFMLPVLVTKKQDRKLIYELLFEQNLSSRDIHWMFKNLSEEWKSTSKQTFDLYQEKLLNEIPSNNPGLAILNLGRLAFFDSLYETGIINYFIASRKLNEAELKREDFPISHLRSKGSGTDREYRPLLFFQKTRYVFDELQQHPLIHHFIFSQLVSARLLPLLTQQDPDKTAESIKYLWDFTKDLAYGLKELADNIRQHASTGEGFVCARFHRKLQEQQAISPLLQQYLEELQNVGEGDPSAILELNVGDLGEVGITHKLLDSSREKLNNISADLALYRLLEEDVNSLQAGNTTLSHLVTSHKNGMLNQQSKRSIAHLGLLIFNKLIRKNRGMILAFSKDPAGNPEFAREPELPGVTLQMPFGTRISFILPVFPGQPYKLHLPHALHLPAEESSIKLKGLETILKVTRITNSWKPSNPPRDKEIIHLLEIQLPGDSITDRKDEERIWALVRNKTQEILHLLQDDDRLLVNLDLNEASLEASKLFRLLGNFEIEFPKPTMIISNLSYELVEKLLELNDLFLTGMEDKLPFWSDRNITLLYHYLKLSNGNRFYFTDGLWGKDRKDFYYLNKLIYRNHFNATTIRHDLMNTSLEEPSGLRNIDNSAAFYNGNVLLPLDILLTGSGNVSIFEHNAKTLLSNPIKPNTLL